MASSIIEQHSQNEGIHVLVIVNHGEIDIGCQISVQGRIFYPEFELLFPEIIECACLGSQVPAVQCHGIIPLERVRAGIE